MENESSGVNVDFRKILRVNYEKEKSDYCPARSAKDIHGTEI
jgi:hypothetical protein